MEPPRINPAFIGDDGKPAYGHPRPEASPNLEEKSPENQNNEKGRDTWGKGVEFLFSCIAMSVGLGNVWRFPFTALDNGGGAFLIPYLIVLFLIGKPIYYIEMAIGQFSSCGSVKVFNFCPAMKGIGIGQVVSISLVTTYYVAIMSMILRYLFDSFKSPLPWTICNDAWNETCIASGSIPKREFSATNYSDIRATQYHNKTISSAELYFMLIGNGPIENKNRTGSPSLWTNPWEYFGKHLLSRRHSTDYSETKRGIGLGQAFIVFILATYYEAICALIAYYLLQSFRDPLPWSYCQSVWEARCIDAASSSSLEDDIFIDSRSLMVSGRNWSLAYDNLTTVLNQRVMSSTELYFVKDVLREQDDIDDGIGWPNWELVLGLLLSWSTVFLVIRRGVKSSGKAAYFLAIFPYVIMAILLVRAVTLPGSADGIIYFIRPDWGKILDPKVWYAAVTQCFYSLSVCFGNIIMYASFNKFNHNIHRDAMIVTTLDTFTSLISGFTIFGILGNLAYEIGTDDIGTVVRGGTGLAFISYPDAISKFKTLPQIFSVLFFLMLFILGIGSNIAMTSCTVTALRDSFPKIKQWHCALAISVISFFLGLAYVTPGGQFILTLVDFYGASMITLVLGISELYVLGWIYGVDRLCKDIEFMIGHKVGLYWRWCWALITPGVMTVILIYFYATYQSLTYNNVQYPTWAYALGWTITAIGISQVPFWAIVAIIRHPGESINEKIRGAFRPVEDWGPSDPLLREQYYKLLANDNESMDTSCWGKVKKNFFG